MAKDDTENYINSHIARVRARLDVIIRVLTKRSLQHDDSKLEEPELSLWKKMDKEQRYPYGSKEYFDKIKRNRKVFELHYMKNRHHPEHYVNGVRDMTLIDVTEMLCDWIGYKDNLSFSEASDIVHQQMIKYGIASKDDSTITLLEQVMLNTLYRYFSMFVEIADKPDGVLEELESPSEDDYDYKKKEAANKIGHIIDIYA
jgi:hypothetical protein